MKCSYFFQETKTSDNKKNQHQISKQIIIKKTQPLQPPQKRFLCFPCMHHASSQSNGCTRRCWCQDALLTIANYLHFQQRESELKADGTAKDWNFKLGINCSAVDKNCCPNSLNKNWHVLKCLLPTAFHNANSPALPGCHGNHRITPITPCSHFTFCCSTEAAFPLHKGACSLLKNSTTTSSHHKVTKTRKFTTQKNCVQFSSVCCTDINIRKSPMNKKASPALQVKKNTYLYFSVGKKKLFSVV